MDVVSLTTLGTNELKAYEREDLFLKYFLRHCIMAPAHVPAVYYLKTEIPVYVLDLFVFYILCVLI